MNYQQSVAIQFDQVFGKQRPRATAKSDKVIMYTPSKTVEIEKELNNTIATQHPELYNDLRKNAFSPHWKTQPIGVEITIYTIKLISKPDVDNVLKIILDAFQSKRNDPFWVALYDDDKQVVDVKIRKFAGTPKVKIVFNNLATIVRKQISLSVLNNV